MPTVLTPEQQKAYAASQGSAANPLSPQDYLSSLQGTLPQADRTGGAADPSTIPEAPTTGAPSDLGNFRSALRAAVEEAGKTRMSRLNDTLGGLNIQTPGTIGAISDLLRSSTAPSVSAVFSDFYEAYKDADELKKKELDRILELRLEYGSAIPDNVTTFAEAVKYATPLIDAERDLAKKERLSKLAGDHAEDGSLANYAACLALGLSPAECGVPDKLRASAAAMAEKLGQKQLDEEFETQKLNLQDEIEAKRLTFDEAIENAWSIEDPNKRRAMIDFIHALEAQKKDAKKTGGAGGFLKGILGGGGGPAVKPLTDVVPAYGKNNFATIPIDARIAQLNQALGTGSAGATKKYLEEQLMRDGYDPNEIAKRTRTGTFDKKPGQTDPFTAILGSFFGK